jgi:hypothetical protein
MLFLLRLQSQFFGLAVSKYLINGQSKVVPAPDLINNQSKVAATPAKCQSAIGLVELHWKVMVHMACSYLTKKQMPCTFWFYLITHAAQMMNAIPGKHSGCLASPFLLVYSVGHDEQTWVPLFLLAYFHHKKDGNVQRYKHQAHTMDGIVIGCSPIIIHLTSSTTSQTATALTPIVFLVWRIYPKNTTVVCFAAFSVMRTPRLKKNTPLAPE